MGSGTSSGYAPQSANSKPQAAASSATWAKHGTGGVRMTNNGGTATITPVQMGATGRGGMGNGEDGYRVVVKDKNGKTTLDSTYDTMSYAKKMGELRLKRLAK